MNADLLRLEAVSKSYSAPVLIDVDLQLIPGEVHALVGENGAGKSTLARIMAGLTLPDRGRMTLRGTPFAPANKREAEAKGVRLVMQELNLIGTLSIAENIFLDQLPHRFGLINYRQLDAQARAVMDQVGLNELDPRRPVASLGVGQQQLVEIGAGLSSHCQLLILDEPTAALTDPEIDRLFAQIQRLQSAGVTLIYISHRLEEIQRIANRITVLRDGQVVTTRDARALSLPELVRLMSGRDIAGSRPERPQPRSTVALRVQGLRAGSAVQDVSFELHSGEILGFAGLMGSGRTETMRAIFGADPKDAGEVYLRGSNRPARIRSPHEAVKQGLALLTEDRKGQGLLLPWPVRANISLVHLQALSSGRSWLRRRQETDTALAWTRKLNIRCASVEQRALELSGGNQQKVVIGKWLFRDCDILIFDEPTRGIDVGAKFEIYQLLESLAAEGKAILVVSSELKELLGLCDRIAVMSAGRLAALFSRGDWSEERIMAAAFSGYAHRQVNKPAS